MMPQKHQIARRPIKGVGLHYTPLETKTAMAPPPMRLAGLFFAKCAKVGLAVQTSIDEFQALGRTKIGLSHR